MLHLGLTLPGLRIARRRLLGTLLLRAAQLDIGHAGFGGWTTLLLRVCRSSGRRSGAQ